MHLRYSQFSIFHSQFTVVGSAGPGAYSSLALQSTLRSNANRERTTQMNAASTGATPAAKVVNDRREIFGWMMYDWANSAFSTTVVAALLGPYLTALAQAAVGDNGVVL